MTQRLDYATLAAPIYQKLAETSFALKKHSSLDKKLLHLVDLRASQMNGCAFCVDMHTKQAKLAGERELRLYHVAVWRESPLFDAKERAAFEWTEAVTRLDPQGVPDEVYNRVRNELSEKELSELTFAIGIINAWNRLAVPFRTVPGSADEAFGLTLAGLS